MSYQLKLTGPGGEIRRLSFDAQPSWSALRARIASLFSIRSDAVAVSYEDSDGDVVTMNSQEELQDYFQNCYKPNQIAKFFVIDKAQSQRPTEEDPESLNGEGNGGLPTMGPTMFIEVDDGGWQRIPRMPGIFGLQEEDGLAESDQGAFVEVVDSDTASSKKGTNGASSEHTPGAGMSTRQMRYKGKQRAFPGLQRTKSSSSASVVDNDIPTKPSIHVYDVSDVGGPSSLDTAQEVRDHTQQARRTGIEDLVGSFGTVYPVSPPQDAFKQIPKASEFLNASEPNQHRSFPIGGSELGSSAAPPPGDLPSLDLEGNSRSHDESVGSRTPTVGQNSAQQPSFVHDVADLVDNVTHLFASHPELSEGVRNIVRNAVGGRYWSTERERMSNVAENVRDAAEETSSRITEAVGSMANNAERDAVRVIAETLGGVFRVIGELSGATPSARLPEDTPVVASSIPVPPPHHHRSSSPRQRHYTAWNEPHGHHGRTWGAPHHATYGFDHQPSQPGARGFGPLYSQQYAPVAPQGQQNDALVFGTYDRRRFDGSVVEDHHGGAVRPNLHETKAQLEAAKAIYKAEKERFRQEKEERRRQRREMAQKRVEGNRVQRADGTMREEEIVARLPLHHSSGGRHPQQPYTEVRGAVPRPSDATAGAVQTSHEPSAQPALFVPPGTSATHTSILSAVDPAAPVPPAPIPAPVTVVPQAPPAPVIPPPPPVPPAPVTNVVRPAPATARSAARDAMSQPMPLASGPYPWPIPPAHDASRRRHLTTLRERIEARLFDMGITPVSQPDMLDILNACTSRTDAPDDEEVLADVLSAMNIRGSPSPRVGSSGLPR